MIYDTESKEVVVSLPKNDQIVFFQRDMAGGNLKQSTISYSPIIFDEFSETIDRYRASNSFGRVINVEKIKVRLMGIGLLSKRSFEETVLDKNPSKDEVGFRIKMAPLNAQALLSKCFLSMVVEVKFNDMTGYVLHGIHPTKSLLIKKMSERMPTEKNTLHVLSEELLLPVQLRSIRLIDQEGNTAWKFESSNSKLTN